VRTILSLAVWLFAAALPLVPASAREEIRIGVTGTFTGPAASIGIPYKQAAELFPSRLGGRSVKWIVLDDAGDPAAAGGSRMRNKSTRSSVRRHLPELSRCSTWPSRARRRNYL
jgi:hypothetical protein